MEKVDIPAKFKDLVDKIEQITVLDLAELVKILEKKFGVSAQAPAAVAVGGGVFAAEPAEEKTSFDVELVATGEQKIQVIKILKEALGLGLKEAKDATDAVPFVVKKGAKKGEAEELKKKLEEVGAKVVLN